MKKIWYIGIALLLWQCQDIKYPEAPENLIDRETMIQVYTDAYLANASKNFNRTILLREQIALTEYIYKKYDIDSLQYEKSNAFYSADLDNYRDMFLQVQENINARFREVDSIVEQEEEEKKRYKDSMRELQKRRRDSLGLGIQDSTELETSIPPKTEDSLIKPAVKRTLQGEIAPKSKNDSGL